MKKKIFMLFLFVVAIVLASCSKNTSREDIIKTLNLETEISSAISEKYGLSFAKTDKLEELATFVGSTESQDTNDFYSLYVAKDTEASLFRYSFDATEELNSHIFDRKESNGNKGRNKNKTMSVNTLILKSLTDAAEAVCKTKVTKESELEEETVYYKNSMINIILNQKVIDLLYGEEANGVKNLKLTSKFERDVDATFVKTISSVYAGNALNENSSLTITFDTIFLPVFVVRKVGGNKITAPIFLPIYETFSTGDKEIQKADDENNYKLVDSTISSIKKLKFEFEDNKVIG